jgi:hypothetical protein
MQFDITYFDSICYNEIAPSNTHFLKPANVCKFESKNDYKLDYVFNSLILF